LGKGEGLRVGEEGRVKDDKRENEFRVGKRGRVKGGKTGRAKVW
jgi:hypothetical protein